MTSVAVRDFIPPIVPRIVRKLRRLVGQVSDSSPRFHPYDKISPTLAPKWIIDIGANVGDTAVAALKSFPHAKVICFEPVPTTFGVLQRTLAEYAERVHLYPQALSSRSGTALINITSFHGANSLEPQSQHHRQFNPHVREERREEISLTTLDELADSLPTRYADVVKIDVEGHELAVLQGGSQFFRHRVDTLIVEIAFQRDSAWEEQSFLKIHTLLDEYGFRLINIYDIHRSETDDMMVTQMDCVFRHRSRLPALPA